MRVSAFLLAGLLLAAPSRFCNRVRLRLRLRLRLRVRLRLRLRVRVCKAPAAARYPSGWRGRSR